MKIKNLKTKRLKELEARLTTTTAKLDKANRKLAEHENGQDHHNHNQPVSSTLVARRLDEIQNRVNILELNDNEMESKLTTVKNDVDLVDNLVKKTDLISKASENFVKNLREKLVRKIQGRSANSYDRKFQKVVRISRTILVKIFD